MNRLPEASSRSRVLLFAALVLPLAALVVPVAALVVPLPARAQSDEDAARRLFDAGVELVRDGRPDAAVPLFRESLERSRRPTTAFNLAIALRDASELLESITILDALLADTYGELDAEQRDAVGRQQRVVGEQLASLEVELRAETRATLYLDGRALGVLEPSAPRAEWLMPGPHRVRAAIDDGASVEEQVDLAAGERTRLVLRIEEIIASTPEGEPTEAPAHDDSAVWIGVGIALGVAALAAGAIVTGVLLSSSGAPGPTIDPVYGSTQTLLRL